MIKISVQSRAFTLIELLVVISIVSLLISILLPALGAARKRAQTLQCLSNARTLGSAILMYLDTYNQWLPPNHVTLEGHSSQNGLYLIRPFYSSGQGNGMWYNGSTRLPNVQAELCPSNNIKPDGFGYCIVERFDGSSVGKVNRFRTLEYVRPSKTPFLWDSDIYADETAKIYYCHMSWWNETFQFLRHGDENNIWFLDGHAITGNRDSPELSTNKLWWLYSYYQFKW